jgi:AcrR family transcriptional regulator
VPTKRTRTAKPAEERRKDLIDAAAAVFTADGVLRAKVEDITTAADVSKGTFYLYFSSKEDAAAAVWQRFMDDFLAIGVTLLADESVPIGERLVHVLESLTRFVIDHADLYRSVYGVAGTLEIHSAANERMIGLISSAVRSGIASGDLVCERPDLVSRALFHGFCAGANDAIVGYVTIDTEELIAAAGQMTRAVFAIG